jgi:hypothetical protein
MNFIKELRKISEPGQILVKEKQSKRERKKQTIRVKRLVQFNKQGTSKKEHIDHLPCVCLCFQSRSESCVVFYEVVGSFAADREC